MNPKVIKKITADMCMWYSGLASLFMRVQEKILFIY